ncbi:LapA family protein [Alysiella crassa]|nr:lipopolysaccharide assembly protein LapA domain-containing protein [Alysiella crassa]UOP08220.1 lipopolysaccharide assembly protein LapA domain-containing protein [Alysiella crassa]
MKYISLGIKGLILLILLLLAFLNIQDVKFTYLPDQAIDLPLIAVLFGGFVVGTVFGIFAMFGRLLRLRSENHRLHNEVKKTARLTTQDLTAPVAVSGDPAKDTKSK